MMLLAGFYLVVDVWGYRRWAFGFAVIGTNALTIYFLQAFVDFDGIARLVFATGANQAHAALWYASAAFALRWLLLWWMYRRKLFLRV